jgi:hypothetical protein
MYYCTKCGKAPSWNPLTGGICDACWEKDCLKCPFCKEPLIIRAYHERWTDYEPTLVPDGHKAPYLDVGEVHDVDYLDDADHHDYECANCKKNLAFAIGMPVEVLNRGSLTGGKRSKKK